MADDSNDRMAKLTGTVRYNQYHAHIGLPPDAVVHVTLQDVSLMDVAAKRLAEQQTTVASSSLSTASPIPYSLQYDHSIIEEWNTYAVSAAIRSADGTLLWISTTMHPVLTRGAPRDHVDIEVEHVAR